MNMEKKNSLKKILFISIPLVLGFVIFFTWLIQRTVEKTIYTPSDQNFKFCPELKQKGFTTTEKTFNDINLRYYIMKAENSKATLIFYHGSGRSACENRDILENLEDLPLDIILVEYPGYGRDLYGERPSEKPILLNSLTLAKKIKEGLPRNQRLFIYGASMGSAVATYVASKVKPKALILRNPMTSILETAVNLYKSYPPKFIEAFFKNHKFEAFRWAEQVRTNVLILYGEKDDWVPMKLVKKQSSHFSKSKVSFHIIEGAGHMDTYTFPKYKSLLRNFILNNI
tara:strand:- start:169 stop:1023 length:855 start_codon:yes stop_codon:yes gene_type:complete